MKKLLSVLIVLSIIFASGSVLAKDWKKIRVGVEGAYPPFSFTTPAGELDGFDIDIAKALVKAAGAEIVLVSSDWDGIIPSLLARKYDCIIASLSITEERKKKFAFTDKYYQTSARFVARKGIFKEFSKAEMKGKTVGVLRATIHDTYLTENYGSDITIKRYATWEEVYMEMNSGRVDMFLADKIAISLGFMKKAEGKNFEFVGPDLSDPKWFGDGVGIAVRKQDTDLVEKLNAAIDKIRADGTYQKIQDKYFGFDVYGD